MGSEGQQRDPKGPTPQTKECDLQCDFLRPPQGSGAGLFLKHGHPVTAGAPCQRLGKHVSHPLWLAVPLPTCHIVASEKEPVTHEAVHLKNAKTSMNACNHREVGRQHGSRN